MNPSNISHYLFKSVTWIMGLRMGNTVLAFFVSAILARLLDPENLGYYFLIYSVVAICSKLIRVGQGPAAIRLIAVAKAQGQLGRVRQTAILTLLGVSAIGLLFSLVYYLFFGEWLVTHFFRSPALLGLTVLIPLWIVIVGVRSQVAFIFRGMHSVRLAAALDGFFTTLVTLTLVIYLYTREASTSLDEVVIFSIAASATSLLVALLLLYTRIRTIKGEGSIRISEISSVAWPLFLIGLANIGLTRSDMILTGSLLDGTAIAFYGVAMRLNRIVLLQMEALGTVMSPLIARMYTKKEHSKLERVTRMVSTLAIVPLILITLVFVVFGESIIGFIFGQAYGEAYPILLILLGGLLISAAMGTGHQLMVMTGHARELLPIKVVGGIFAIVCAILAAPGMGIIGIALAYSMSRAGVEIITTLKAKKMTGISCYIYTPTYFMNVHNRQALVQEFKRLIRGLLSPKQDKNQRADDDN